MIQKTQKVVYVSGDIMEVYRYERPLYFNRDVRERNVVRTFQSRRYDNLKKAQMLVRRIIFANANAYGCVPIFITFTFAENVKDVKTALKKWRDFLRRIRYEYGSLRYICVIEFQKRGAVHFHVLFFDLPYEIGIKNKWAKIWGHGFLQIKAVQNIRSIGAYVSKYLTKDFVDERLIRKKAYFCSRRLKRPQRYRRPESVAKVLHSVIIQERVLQYDLQTHFYGRVQYSQFKILRK